MKRNEPQRPQRSQRKIRRLALSFLWQGSGFFDTDLSGVATQGEDGLTLIFTPKGDTGYI